ncbi:unnamed protein product [Cladocopium goreaui]|uniref:N-lysine methyltransferase SMYD2-B n=1 Tax=Cladocopium goreaui TaxID=2562237 RepID=A0A9P1DQ77_9DINO|nr:unnamed protein product [Cladocopium goreaui]
MARSAVYDHTLVTIFNAIKVCEQISQTPATPATVATPAPTVTQVDWIQFHGGNGGFHLDTNTKPKSYVGPIAVHEFEGRGLGLVATRKITAGDVLLIEDAFAMSSTCGALISQATAELARTCCNKFAVATPLEMSAFWCLHSQSDCQNPNWKEIGRRKTIFEEYLAHLHAGEIHNNSMQSRYVPKPCLEKQDKAVASIVSSNSRKTEHWNAWTLLLDESESLGGLWLAASLFNHSCLGNVVINYGSSKECGSTLVARAATTIETGEELLHTYVYPFDTVHERQKKLQHIYGFHCCCARCALEAPHALVASQLADRLESELQKFSAARGKGINGRNDMAKIVKMIRSVLASVDKAAEDLSAGLRRLWRSQFLWGDHGLAMAAQEAGLFQEAVDAFRNCVSLVAMVAPSSEYELKYRMMLTQSLSRWALSAPASNLPSADDLKEALKHAEEAHNRLYGGGGRHFVCRMKKRLEDVYAALRRLQS